MKLYERIDGRLRDFVEVQPMFFVATAPNGRGRHVNISPKGMAGTFVVLGEHWAAYLDYHGSGAETIAHLRENGRVTPCPVPSRARRTSSGCTVTAGRCR